MCHKFMAHPLFSFLRSFFSSDFTDESEAFLLIGLLTDFRGYLASGQWLAPEIFPYCFCHADFADDADFSSWKFFVQQISQMTQIFLRRSFCPTDFTDIHRFFMESLVNLFVSLRGYLQRPDRSHPWKSLSNRRSRKSPNKFRVIRWIKSASSAKSAWLKKTPMKNLCISVKSVGLFLTSGGICNDRIGRLRVNPWVIALAGNLRINSVSSDE